MIIRGGENISCTEVQAALHLHPSVAEAAVFAIPDERLGEAVGACVLMGASADLSEEELKLFLKSHIAMFKVPKKIWLRDTPLPRGSTEKIDRLALRAECLGIGSGGTPVDGQSA
jgi:acyl-CoA synthetase (AMP-forming)/AMP-acid ligase II